MAYIDNQSINGLAARWLLPAADSTLPQLGNDPALWRMINLGGALLVLGLEVAGGGGQEVRKALRELQELLYSA